MCNSPLAWNKTGKNGVRCSAPVSIYSHPGLTNLIISLLNLTSLSEATHEFINSPKIAHSGITKVSFTFLSYDKIKSKGILFVIWHTTCFTIVLKSNLEMWKFFVILVTNESYAWIDTFKYQFHRVNKLGSNTLLSQILCWNFVLREKVWNKNVIQHFLPVTPSCSSKDGNLESLNIFASTSLDAISNASGNSTRGVATVDNGILSALY